MGFLHSSVDDSHYQIVGLTLVSICLLLNTAYHFRVFKSKRVFCFHILPLIAKALINILLVVEI